MRKFCVLLLALLTLMLSSCGQTEPKAVTYDELSQQGQAVVDYILVRSRDWDNGCSSTGFSTIDGEPVFKATYLEHSSSDSVAGWTRYYAYDIDTYRFEEVDSYYKMYTGYSASGTTFSPSFLSEWNPRWNDQAKKDYLANQYASYLKN